MLRSQCSGTSSGVRRDLLPARFVPKGQFDSVPEAEFVIDDSQVVFNDVLCRPDLVRDFAVFESLGDEFDDSSFSLAGYPVPIPLFSEE